MTGITRRPPARFVSLALLISLIGACSPIVRGTAGLGSETIPGPGYFHVTGDPAVADKMLTFRYVGPDGIPSEVSDVIQPGGQTVIDRTTLPGSHTLTVNGVPCSGTFSIESDRETDLVVKLTGDGCEVSTVAIHKPGEFTH